MKLLSIAGFGIGLLVLVLAAPVAAQLDIAEAPLSLSTGVAPNILIAIDDSGSMDSEVLLPTNDGALWWNTDEQSFVGLNGEDEEEEGVLNVNKAGGANGTWKKYVYLFPNGTGTGNRVYRDADNDHYAIPPIPQFAYVRSPDYNKAYFNPEDTYLPWPSVGSDSFSNITATAAPSDPASGSFTFNLAQAINSGSDNRKFMFFAGMPLPDGETASDKTAEKVEYYPATFYLTEALPARFSYNGTTLTGYAPDGTSLFGYEIKSANFSSTDAYNAMLQNFANWFSYYRKRHLATRAGVARSFFDVKKARVGEFTINGRGDVTMKDLSVAADRSSLYNTIYSRGGNSGGTPNRAALRHAGLQYQRTGASAPITHACQANATILFTDGYSTLDTFTDIGNADGDKGEPYEDAVASTIADIAMKFYDNHLRADLARGQVPVNENCSASNRAASLDCQTDLHMLTYAVTLGARGTLFDSDNPIDPYQSPPAWPAEFVTRGPTAVDDLWHATINGRGELLNANKPVDIADKLTTAVSNILQSVGSAAAVASNSTRLDTDTLIYQARYDSRDWSGQLLAYNVVSDGALASLAWSTDSSGKIPAHGSRNIFTWSSLSGAGDGASFQWAQLDATQKLALTQDLDEAARDAAGPLRLAWLRGDQTQEGVDTNYRIRSKILGDIVNSNPYYHWAQDYGFAELTGTEGTSYRAYLSAKRSQPAMLYVGANDGMLHAFNAATGVEQFAYVPYAVYGPLRELIKPGYTHKYFVDGSPRVLDAYWGSAWRSVLVGSTAAGGGSVFAIDVSDPDSLDADDVLWDFHTAATDTHKLGAAMSDPVIARLASGDWVAIFGNGYNSGDSLKLFVVKLADGALLAAINTGVDGTSNGLGDVVPVDVDDDRITDYVYAGDLTGNVWKFDLTANASASWEVAFTDSGDPAPLFTATDADGTAQPITGRIAVGRHPDSGVMLYFGTGQYFESSDSTVGTTPQTQTFYGIRDNAAVVAGRSELQAQTITSQGALSLNGANNNADSDLRIVSSNTVDYSAKKGWYLDLKLSSASHGGGERVIAQPILRYDRLIFPTLTPSANPCNFGGTSWLMELDAVNGSRLDYSVFDANGDGVINYSDLVNLSDTLIPPSGTKFDQLISRPGIVSAGEKEYKYTSGSRGGIGVTTERGNGFELGRQAWWQLR